MMTFELIRGDARHVSDLLAPASVDLIITSPPYYALRSYRDECEACGGTGEWREGVEATSTPRLQNTNGTGSSTLNRGRGVGPYEAGIQATQTAKSARRYTANRRCDRCDLITDRLRCNRCQGSTRVTSQPAPQNTSTRAVPLPPTPPGGCPACNGTGRAHYDGQIGSEPTPGDFVDALIECTRDWLKVLKPGGSIFVNLGDKRAGSNGQSGGASQLVSGTYSPDGTRTKDAKKGGYTPKSDIPTKSLMGLPWRYALRCVDELGLILRADIIWHKPNGLPESVTDRVRQSHEYWFHLTREPRYFAAVDEVREAAESAPSHAAKYSTRRHGEDDGNTHRVRPTSSFQYDAPNPLGKLPGSVWTIPSEPLTVPANLGVDHFAAFPSEWPRRLIAGWSPSGWCQACGEARRPVVEKAEWWAEYREHNGMRDFARRDLEAENGAFRAKDRNIPIPEGPKHQILGYACACPDTTAPTRPAVVLDPFAGTGTTVAVAHHLGRHGIGIDLSSDYLRLAEWRCTSDTALRDKVLQRSDLPKAPKIDGQLALDLTARGLGG